MASEQPTPDEIKTRVLKKACWTELHLFRMLDTALAVPHTAELVKAMFAEVADICFGRQQKPVHYLLRV
jgi:hypothetical protein